MGYITFWWRISIWMSVITDSLPRETLAHCSDSAWGISLCLAKAGGDTRARGGPAIYDGADTEPA